MLSLFPREMSRVVGANHVKTFQSRFPFSYVGQHELFVVHLTESLSREILFTQYEQHISTAITGRMHADTTR
jgi:hypothetical protein